MKSLYTNKRCTANTSSTIISTLYNCIQMPIKPKCSVCDNQQVERQLQKIQKQNYIRIPDRYVDIFVCNFCKKLDEPKCKYCWETKSCCTYKSKKLYDEYYKSIKQEIIRAAQSISQTYRFYESKSTEDLSFPMTAFISPESINKQLTIFLHNVQQQLKKEVEQNLATNYHQLFEVYRQFQTDLVCRLYPYSPQGVQRLRKDLREIGFKDKVTKNLSLPDCVKWLKQLENHKIEIQKMAHQVCDKYFEKMNYDYPKILYHRLNDAFRTILLPKVSYKDALIQTTQNPGSTHSINSEKSIKQKKQQNAGAIIDEKVAGLQKVIQKNFEVIQRLQDRIKDLEFIVNVQQSKSQQLEMKVLQLQAKYGISHRDRDVSMIQDPFIDAKNTNLVNRIIQNKSFEFKQGIKQSRSDPNLLNYSQIIVSQERELTKEKIEQALEQSYQQHNKEKFQQKISRPRKQSEGKKFSKDKSMLENSSWLQQVVSEIKQ